MAKVTYGDGTVISFSGDPSPQDIEEAYSQVKGQGTPIDTQSTPTIAGSFSLPDRAEPISDEPSPLDLGQRLALSFPKHIEAKKQLLGQMGFQDIQDVGDGKLYVNGKPVDPTPSGFLSLLRDLPGDVADLGGPSLPIAGQIGADLAAVGSGVGIPGILGANAAGAATGEIARQGIASALTGSNQMNAMDVDGEGALGAAGVGVAEGVLNPMLRGGSRLAGKYLGFAAKKLQDSFPALAQFVYQLDKNKEIGRAHV